MLSDDNPGNSGPFLDSHWEGREGNKKKKKIQFDRLKKSWKDEYFLCSELHQKTGDTTWDSVSFNWLHT